MGGRDICHDEEYEERIAILERQLATQRTEMERLGAYTTNLEREKRDFRSQAISLEHQLAKVEERNSRLWEMLHWWQKTHPNSRVSFCETFTITVGTEDCPLKF